MSRRRPMRACWKSRAGRDTSRWRSRRSRREVVGIDLTEAPLKIAEKMRARARNRQRQLPQGRRRVAPAIQGRRVRCRRVPLRGSSFCRAGEGDRRDGARVPCRRLGGDRGFDRQRTARARRVLQRIRKAARHVAYQRARDERANPPDGRGGTRDSAIHVAWLPDPGHRSGSRRRIRRPSARRKRSRWSSATRSKI